MLGFLPSSMSVCGAENAQPQLSTPANQTFWPNNTKTNKKKHNWKWPCLKTMSRKTLGACISFHDKKKLIHHRFIIIFACHLRSNHLFCTRANATPWTSRQGQHKKTDPKPDSIHSPVDHIKGWLRFATIKQAYWWSMTNVVMSSSMSSICVYSEMWWYHLSGHCVLLPAGFFSCTSSHLNPSRASNFYLKCFFCFYFSRAFNAGGKLDSD